MSTSPRILTVREPWATAIIHAGKNVENRPRNIVGDYRGPVLIHVADTNRPTRADLLEFAALHEDAARALAPWPYAKAGYGHVIGVVDIESMHHADECGGAWSTCREWGVDGQHHIMLTNVRPVDEPFPYTGALGLRHTSFEITPDGRIVWDNHTYARIIGG